jgi:hypothetical protein
MQSHDLDANMFRDLSTSFTKAYSICYLVSPLLGLHISTIGYFAIACVGNFLKLIPWSPVFTVNQYISMAFLDLFQSMFLFKLFKE